MALAIVVGLLLGLAFYTGNPIISYNAEWMETASYHMHNNSTWLNMTSKQQTAFMLFPFLVNLPWFIPMSILGITHRKDLWINGKKEGKVMFVYGMDTWSFLIDGYSILHGFKKVPWKDIPRPISLTRYDGMIIIYYKPRFLTLPWEWLRVRIDTEDQAILGVKSIFLKGKYHKMKMDKMIPTNTFMHLTDKIPFKVQEPNLETFQKYHKKTIKRIQKDNNEMIQSNPQVIGPMVQSSIMVVPTELKEEFLDLLPEDAKRKYLHDAYQGLYEESS